MKSKNKLPAFAAGCLLYTCLTQISYGSGSEQFQVLTEGLVTADQPTPEDLASLKKSGVTKIINLRRSSEEISFNEREEAEKLGFEYISFPISGEADITIENAKKLHKMLEGQDKVFLHCATGNRVGALLAIRAHEIEGKPIDESLELGRAAGLSSLEKAVTSVLSEGKSATPQ